MLTDPQNDVPCTECETEGPLARLDEDGRCHSCHELIDALADAIEGGGTNDEITERLIDALPGLSWSDCSIALRRLVGPGPCHGVHPVGAA